MPAGTIGPSCWGLGTLSAARAQPNHSAAALDLLADSEGTAVIATRRRARRRWDGLQDESLLPAWCLDTPHRAARLSLVNNVSGNHS